MIMSEFEPVWLTKDSLRKQALSEEVLKVLKAQGWAEEAKPAARAKAAEPKAAEAEAK
jgi:UDP:flavonoid glycosyltransferase YjiC (YdhE family)